MNNKKGLLKSLLPWLILLAGLSIMIPFLNQGNSHEIKYNEFVKVVQDEKVQSVKITPSSLVIDVDGVYTKKVDGQKKEVSFSTTIPKTDSELDS